MILFLDILETGYFVLWIFTCLICLRIGSINSIWALVFLSAAYACFWNEELWHNPEEMFRAHLVILGFMVLTPKNPFWRRFFILSLVVVCADAFWMAMDDIYPFLSSVLPEMPHYFPYADFWWQSSLYLLFVALCALTLKMCHNTHKIRGLQKELKHDYFWAFIADFFAPSGQTGGAKIPSVRSSKRVG